MNRLLGWAWTILKLAGLGILVIVLGSAALLWTLHIALVIIFASID